MQTQAGADENQLMSIGKAAKYLGISRDTLRRWEKAGKISTVRSPTNRRFYTKAQLDNIRRGVYIRSEKTPDYRSGDESAKMAIHQRDWETKQSFLARIDGNPPPLAGGGRHQKSAKITPQPSPINGKRPWKKLAVISAITFFITLALALLIVFS